MATVTLDGDSLAIALTTAEKVAGLRGDLRVPLSAVRDATVAPDALSAARGLRAPGLAIPGRMKIGTWRGRGRRSLVVARRGVPAVRVTCPGAAVDELLVSSAHAAAVVGAIRARLGSAESETDARELQVAIPTGGLVLSGTLLLPPGPGPHPAAVIVPGSGPLDRDSSHGRFPLGIGRDLADALVGRGVASLRYDRRGVGASGGDFLSAGLHDNAADLAAALAWLRARPEIRGAACALVGHSEGALLATAVAGGPDGDGLAGVVLLAGAAKTGEETLAWQTRQIAPGLPAPVRLLLRLLRVDIVAKQAKNVERLKATTTDVARIGGRRVNARWHRELIAFDPGPLLRRIRAPLLAITGDKDIQVDPADLEAIQRAVGGDVTTIRMPDLTHILRRDPGRPTLGAYRQLLREPTDPEVLDVVAGWVAARGA